MRTLDKTEKIVVICPTGERSARAVAILRDAGFTRAMNLEGGLDRFSREVDPGLPAY